MCFLFRSFAKPFPVMWYGAKNHAPKWIRRFWVNKKKLNPDRNVRENKVWIQFLLDWLNKLRTWLKKLISDTTSQTESLREIKFNALNSLCWFKFRLKNNFLKQKNADKNSHAKPFRKKFWILTFWIFFVPDFYKLDAEFLKFCWLKIPLKLNLTDQLLRNCHIT